MFQFLPITDVYARKIFDSQGNPTLEVEIAAGEHCLGTGKIPARCMSKIGKEQYEENDLKNAVIYVNETIARELMEVNIFEQDEIDHILDKLKDVRQEDKLAVRIRYALSVAAVRCAAQALKIPVYKYVGGIGARKLPIPILCIVAGEREDKRQAHKREFMAIPAGAKDFKEAIQICIDVYQEAIEGGKSQGLNLELLKSAAKSAGHEPGKDVYFSANCSAMENAVWIKPDRIGTVSQVIEHMRSVQKEGQVVVLTSGGETDDTFLAELAVATGCNLIRLGTPEKAGNVGIYNRLSRIEEELGAYARFSAFCEH